MMIAPWLAAVLVAQTASTDRLDRVGQEIVELVHTRFYNADQAQAWFGAHGQYASGIHDRGRFVDRTRAALAELHASHTSYYTPDDPEFHAIHAIFDSYRPGPDPTPGRMASLGIDVRSDGFVRRIFAASPAAGSGVSRGDRIVAVDGQEFTPARLVHAQPGVPVTLLVQSTQGDQPRPVRITPRLVSLKSEWLEDEKQGTRILHSPGGKRVLYVPYYCGAGNEFTTALEEIIRSEQSSADVMLLDARGGWGGSPADLISRFDRSVPAMRMIPRTGEAFNMITTWRKPLVVLTDSGTRSGKEVFCHAVKTSRRGILVGRTTAGAVLGGSPFSLSDGSLLFLAVSDVEIDGQRLEGIGVKPDREVADDLEFAQGRDLTLETGLVEADNAP